jgi:two-component system nitrate/nitrite response regulator NarL
VLIATDADWIYDEVAAALGGPDREMVRVRSGEEVLAWLAEADAELVVLDLQIGNMGGMATCMAVRLEVGADRLDDVPILMLLDREADVFLARRCDADGWLVKPIDAFRLRRAAEAVIAGERYTDGMPLPEPSPAS